MKTLINHAKTRFSAISRNEKLARVFVMGFLIPFDPETALLADIKTCVSEAVTNCVVHAYPEKEDPDNPVFLELKLYDDGSLTITVTDRGVGIADVEAARQPFFTTDREGERSGMGLPIMEAFSERFGIVSSPKGTRVTMKMHIR